MSDSPSELWRPDHCQDDIWIFAYGSLMWRPDFDHIDIQPAVLEGYHRSLCIKSIAYRGTEECPGLVFGLEEGGSCEGRALKVASDKAEEVMAKLYQREMITRVYQPKWLEVSLPKETVTAYLFVSKPKHRQFAGKLEPEEAVKLILQGVGTGGPCLEYVTSTADHLREMGIVDSHLEELIELAEKAKL